MDTVAVKLKTPKKPRTGTSALQETRTVASDTTSSHFVASTADGILWLLPGVHRMTPPETCIQLFQGYDLVCRVNRSAKIAVPGTPERETLAYRPGDAIAATTVDNEERLVELLASLGLSESSLVMGPGVRSVTQ